MNPEERTCENCWCRQANICRLRPVEHREENQAGSYLEPTWCGCADHRTDDEQARLWAARDMDARAILHEMGKLTHDADFVGRVEEKRAVAKWLRWIAGCAVASTAEIVLDVADRIEAGEHRKASGGDAPREGGEA